MAARIVKVEPFDLVVFGGTGDLAYRKLYPALMHREKSEQFSEPTRIIGVSRRHYDRDAFRAAVKDASAPSISRPVPISSARWRSVSAKRGWRRPVRASSSRSRSAMAAP